MAYHERRSLRSSSEWRMYRATPVDRLSCAEEHVLAVFKYQQYLAQINSVAFDHIHRPGQATPFSGIYRCEGCGINEVSTQGHPLPPQNHHQHTFLQGAIRWRLAVATH